jgi:hypothetical protein
MNRASAFSVDDIDDVAARLRSHGAELVGEIAQYDVCFPSQVSVRRARVADTTATLVGVNPKLLRKRQNRCRGRARDRTTLAQSNGNACHAVGDQAWCGLKWMRQTRPLTTVAAGGYGRVV